MDTFCKSNSVLVCLRSKFVVLYIDCNFGLVLVTFIAPLISEFNMYLFALIKIKVGTTYSVFFLLISRY